MKPHNFLNFAQMGRRLIPIKPIGYYRHCASCSYMGFQSLLHLIKTNSLRQAWLRICKQMFGSFTGKLASFFNTGRVPKDICILVNIPCDKSGGWVAAFGVHWPEVVPLHLPTHQGAHSLLTMHYSFRHPVAKVSLDVALPANPPNHSMQ